MTKRAMIYTRTATMNGPLAEQEQACRAYATAQGWEVLAVCADAGASANDENRPGLQCLLRNIAEDHIDAVLVTTRDRLTRRASLWYQLLQQLADSNVAVVAIQEQGHE